MSLELNILSRHVSSSLLSLKCEITPILRYCSIYILFLKQSLVSSKISKIQILLYNIAIILCVYEFYSEKLSRFVNQSLKHSVSQTRSTHSKGSYPLPILQFFYRTRVRSLSGVHFSFDVLPSCADQGSCAHKCCVKIFRTVTRNDVNKGRSQIIKMEI